MLISRKDTCWIRRAGPKWDQEPLSDTETCNAGGSVESGNVGPAVNLGWHHGAHGSVVVPGEDVGVFAGK